MTIRHHLIAAISIIASTLGALALGSCSTSMRAAAEARPALSATPSIAGTAAEVASVAATYGSWERLRIPVKLELNSPKSISISGTATMLRNNSIHISLRYFGFEIGWMYLTSDSITITDKYHKRYMAEAIRPFLAGAPVTIANVQDLLLGRMFEMGSSTSLTTDQISLGSTEMDQMLLFIPRNPESTPFRCGFALIPSASEITTLMLYGAVIGSESKDNPVEVRYGVAASTKAGPMTTSTSFLYQTGKTNIDATLYWNLEKARWADDVQLPSTSVRGYSRVTLDMITSMISKL